MAKESSHNGIEHQPSRSKMRVTAWQAPSPWWLRSRSRRAPARRAAAKQWPRRRPAHGFLTLVLSPKSEKLRNPVTGRRHNYFVEKRGHSQTVSFPNRKDPKTPSLVEADRLARLSASSFHLSLPATASCDGVCPRLHLIASPVHRWRG
jgi:hypothetical protein